MGIEPIRAFTPQSLANFLCTLHAHSTLVLFKDLHLIFYHGCFTYEQRWLTNVLKLSQHILGRLLGIEPRYPASQASTLTN